MAKLYTNGYIVVRVYPKHEVPELIEEFKQTCAAFPEFQGSEYKSNITFNGKLYNPYVLNTIGAFGNPSSFHNPFVRKIRAECHRVGSKILKKFDTYFDTIHNTGGRKLQCLFDRMSLRHTGATVQGQSWHRDITIGSNPSDTVFGGWIALHDTIFSCCPGTQVWTHERLTARGFTTVDKADVRDLEKKQISVPAGCMIIFNQTIIHELAKIRNIPSELMRVYTGFRLTQDTKYHSVFGEYENVLASQALPKLSGGIPPAMYTKMHAMMHMLTIVVPWCQATIAKKYLVAGTCEQYMGTTANYEKYTTAEARIMLPHVIEIV